MSGSSRFYVLVAPVAAIILGFANRSDAGVRIDATGDFLASYTAGPQNGDLDVTSVEVNFDGTHFLFTGTMAGAIGTTPGALYVWGVNRGQGTARFGALASNVLFDSVVLLRPDGTGTVNRIVGGGATALSAGDVTIFGDTITARVSASFLPSLGFATDDFTFNLWPRLGAGNNNQISDFAPDNSNITVTGVPEPTSIASGAIGLLTAAGLLYRRRRSS